jgi:hypothetical protein
MIPTVTTRSGADSLLRNVLTTATAPISTLNALTAPTPTQPNTDPLCCGANPVPIRCSTKARIPAAITAAIGRCQSRIHPMAAIAAASNPRAATHGHGDGGGISSRVPRTVTCWPSTTSGSAQNSNARCD